MNKKPLIGIISKPNIFCDNALFTQQVVYDGPRNALIKNGALVIGLLPTQMRIDFCKVDDVTDNTILSEIEKEDLHTLIDKCDGIVLQGGLSSESYEIEAAKYAIKNDIPLLGICAGFNNIIRAMGGEVFLMNDPRHNNEEGLLTHSNSIKPNTLLHDILRTNDVDVNSIHTMFARDENVKNLEISAYSDDGFVEAVELKDKRFCLGVKWHPELMTDDEKMNRIIGKFVDTCKNQ